MPLPLGSEEIWVELVGHPVRIEEGEDGIRMDFLCTNKVEEKDIIVPPILKHNLLSDRLLRVFVQRKRREDGTLSSERVLLHTEVAE